MGVRCRLWTVVFVFWPVVVTGRSWVVVGVGRRVVVAVGGRSLLLNLTRRIPLQLLFHPPHTLAASNMPV